MTRSKPFSNLHDSVRVTLRLESANRSEVHAREAVMASGHRDVVLQNVRVEDGDCHVETEKLTVMLEPLP